MKKRNPLAVLILSIVTFGIYDLYWLVKTKKELNKQTRVHVPTIWLLFLPFLLGIAWFVVIMIVSVIAQDAARSGGQPNHGLLGLVILLQVFAWLSWFLIVPITFYWFWKFSKAVGQYTNGKMGTGVTFLLLWLLHLIGVALVQDEFNDMIDAGQQGGMGMPQMAGPAPAGWPQQPQQPMYNGPMQGMQPGQAQGGYPTSQPGQQSGPMDQPHA